MSLLLPLFTSYPSKCLLPPSPSIGTIIHSKNERIFHEEGGGGGELLAFIHLGVEEIGRLLARKGTKHFCDDQ